MTSDSCITESSSNCPEDNIMISNIYNAMKKGEWGEFYDHSKNHTLEETIKKLTSEEMLDQSEEIIKYVQNYGFFDFVRIEKTSHDVIHFVSQPLCMNNPYHEESRCKISYLGGYKNCSCNNFWIEQFYLLPNGMICNQDKKIIADNIDGFFSYITAVEYDFHPTISDNTYRLLEKSGWYRGRKIDISKLIKECKDNGVNLTEAQKQFIEEFGRIRGSKEHNYRNYFFISDKLCSPFSEDGPVYYTNIKHDENISRQLDKEDIDKLVKQYGRNTVYAGNCYYYSNSLLLSENGILLIISSGEFKPIGRTAMECFNYILWK